MTSAEVASFAESVRSIADGIAGPDWSPAIPGDDSSPDVAESLGRVGWHDLATSPDGREFIGPAAVELGRGLVSLREVDTLLGGSPYLAGFTRSAGPGDVAVTPRPDVLETARVMTAEPVPYGDDLGACLSTVGSRVAMTAHVTQAREAAWVAGLVGYLAGLASKGLDLTMEHGTSRIAFGKPLTHIDSVEQRLADAALGRDSLTLLAADHPDLDALAFAIPTATSVLAHCHQVVGALGFTLEYPLNRYSRRVASIGIWSRAWIEARS